MKSRKSESDLLMEKYLAELGVRDFVTEHRFDPKRMWRFDYAIPRLYIGIEIEGGVWTNGRHTRGAGYQGDLDKYNAATSMGWRIFRFSTRDVETGKCIPVLKGLLPRIEIEEVGGEVQAL